MTLIEHKILLKVTSEAQHRIDKQFWAHANNYVDPASLLKAANKNTEVFVNILGESRALNSTNAFKRR